MKRVKKLDQPISTLDDWDFLQAAFEAMLEGVRSHSDFDIETILDKEFPINQSKYEQEQRLKVMLSQRNECGFNQTAPKEETPAEILTDALTRIQNEARLNQQKTIRAFLIPYLNATAPCKLNERLVKSQPWTTYFRREFFEFLAEKKIHGITLLDASPTLEILPKKKLQPGERRTLEALKHAYPNGLIVKELLTLTIKNNASGETPRKSQDVWLSELKALGLVQADKQRPKKWFFVKDYEP